MQRQLFNPLLGVLPVVGWVLMILGGLLLVVAYNPAPVFSSHPILDYAPPRIPSLRPMAGAVTCLVLGLICLIVPYVLKPRTE